MASNNYIPVGASIDTKFVAYGDDSQVDDSLAYAFLFVEREKVPEVEARICTLKKKFAIPTAIPLHCRVLFHPHPRKKLVLGIFPISIFVQ